ncbi:hypothetical protein [Mucilaginibacter sp.]|uniref:hypothetical protein n=1 Tax=Mucilaginibacter sp. TaxID=1882438 RepID=UPI002C28227D|nr:hypothetical protein [Mucilaginibacter sp.]HTI57698.1 hypothetical protein [Mucilaginibacter sp.]
MKSFYKHFYKCTAVFSCILLWCHSASAQMENDGIMIPKNYICAGVSYSTSNWTNYWEGTFKRDNGNIGTLNTQVIGIGATYGITNNVIATLSVPYITTHASAGTLHGEKGIQDLSLNVKWKAYQFKSGSNKLTFFASITGSIPVNNYQADFLPLALGSHSKNFTSRLVVDYIHGKAFFTGSGAYTTRSNTTIDRNSYYTTHLIYSDQVELPNMSDYNFRAGYRSKYFIAEAVGDISTSLGGFDIRKNDMPFPANRMNMTSVGVNFRFRLKSFYGLELTAGDQYVTNGRNVGQSNVIHSSLTYIFGLSKKQPQVNYNKN